MEAKELEQSMGKYYHELYGRARYMLNSHHDAEDAVQTAFCKAWAHRADTAAMDDCRPWLRQIAHRECLNILRKRKRKEFPMDANIAGARLLIDDELTDYADALALWYSICDLPAVSAQVMVLYYYQGYSIKRIAQKLHIPIGTVKTRMYRARKKLSFAWMASLQ